MSRRTFLGHALGGGAAAVGAPLLTRRTARAQSPSSLVVAQEAFPPSMDPIHGQQLIQGKRIWLELYDRPVNTNAAGETIPGLATEWEMLDPRTWQFKLREGVTFHDGTAFDAEAMKFVIDTLIQPETNNTYMAYAGPVTGVEVVDPRTVNVTTDEPFPLLPMGLSLTAEIVPISVESAGWESFAQHPIGTGPFTFVEFTPNDRVVLDANPDYWGGSPQVDQVIFRYIPEAATRAAALQAGEVHIASGLSPDAAQQIEASGGTVVSILLTRGVVVDFNETMTDHPINQDKRVRQALNYAVNKESILNDLFLGYGALMNGQIPQEGTFGYNPDLQPYPYDPERARALLAEAGFAEGFEMEIATQAAFGHQEVATAVAGQLAEIGVTVTLNVLEAGVFANQKQETQLGPAFTSSWSALGDASQNLIWYTSASTIGQYHLHPEWDELILGANQTLDMAEREQMFHDVTALMHDAPPCIWTIRMADLWGVAPNVADVEMNPFGYLYLANARFV